MSTTKGRGWIVAIGLLLGSTTAARASDDAAAITRGTEVYGEQRCATCHAIGGVGNRRNPLDGVGSRLSADDIRKWIVAPREMNPKVRKRAYDSLPAADLDALVTYLVSLKKP